MKPFKIERVAYFEGGLERRSLVHLDEQGLPIKPETLSEEASKEWDNIMKWAKTKGLAGILDGIALRDHCLRCEQEKSNE